MNDLREQIMAKRVAKKVVCSQVGTEAWKALGRAHNELQLAEQRLRMVLGQDNPENPEEIMRIIDDLHQMSWQINSFRDQVYRLARS